MITVALCLAAYSLHIKTPTADHSTQCHPMQQPRVLAAEQSEKKPTSYLRLLMYGLTILEKLSNVLVAPDYTEFGAHSVFGTDHPHDKTMAATTRVRAKGLLHHKWIFGHILG